MSVTAILLLVCWFGWGYPFIMRAPHRQKRPSIARPKATALGSALQGTAIFVAWVFRLPGDPGLVRMTISACLGPVAVFLAWASVKHLGKQWRIQAGLYSDHELIQTGPYKYMRHPVYCSLLLLLLATLALLTEWPWALVSIALYIAGAEIRIRAEEELLASRFGADFDRYRRTVHAYVPFIR